MQAPRQSDYLIGQFMLGWFLKNCETFGTFYPNFTVRPFWSQIFESKKAFGKGLRGVTVHTYLWEGSFTVNPPPPSNVTVRCIFFQDFRDNLCGESVSGNSNQIATHNIDILLIQPMTHREWILRKYWIQWDALSVYEWVTIWCVKSRSWIFGHAPSICFHSMPITLAKPYPWGPLRGYQFSRQIGRLEVWIRGLGWNWRNYRLWLWML